MLILQRQMTKVKFFQFLKHYDVISLFRVQTRIVENDQIIDFSKFQNDRINTSLTNYSSRRCQIVMKSTRSFCQNHVNS